MPGTAQHSRHRKPRPRRQLSESQLAAEVKRRGAVCPLPTVEITKWSRKLGGTGTDDERRLETLVTYWFDQARSLIPGAHEQELARSFTNRPLAPGDPPDAAARPKHIQRVDKSLLQIADRANSVYLELLALPDDVNAALHIRFSEYDTALLYLARLPSVLNTIAAVWHRPRRGQPSLEMESYAVELQIYSVEDFTKQSFPPPRSYKRLAEIDFVRLLVARLLPSSAASEITTMLRHFHNRRLKAPLGSRPPRHRRDL
jgi:hypothetical protein